MIDLENQDELGTRLTPGERRRRATLLLFGFVALAALMLSGTYVVVRAMSESKIEAATATPEAPVASARPTAPLPQPALAQAPEPVEASEPEPAANLPEAATEPHVAAADLPEVMLTEAEIANRPKLPPMPNYPAHPGHPVLPPQPGSTYLQVAAARKAIAEVFVEALAVRGFQASVAPGPDPVTFRVLVGPVADRSVLRNTKDHLAVEGFFSFVRYIPLLRLQKPSGA